MQADPSIFKAYDIRGIYPDRLNEAVAYAVGRAFVSFLACAEVVVGRDMRLSSPAIKENLLNGLPDPNRASSPVPTGRPPRRTRR